MTEGKFSFSSLLHYLKQGSYPEELNLSKERKLCLRKRAKYFTYKNEDLYYIGGPSTSSDKYKMMAVFFLVFSILCNEDCILALALKFFP